MHKSSCALIAAPAAVALAVPSADAAGRVPLDVTATECLPGSGSFLVLRDGQGGWIRQCQGGTHDGETGI